jgi:hypothetical protein
MAAQGSEKSRWRKGPEGRPGAAALIALGGTVALIVVQLAQSPPDSTTLILAGLATVLLFTFFAPRETSHFFRRMTNLKVVGVVEIALGTVARAETISPPGIEDDEAKPRNGEELPEAVATLKEKIRFVHAITHLRDEIDNETSYREIVHMLAAEHLLRPNEAQFVLDLLAERDLGLDDLPGKALEKFLDATWSFSSRFGLVVWDRYVRSELWKEGWVVADFWQSSRFRPDFLACWRGEWVVMAARVGETERPSHYPTTRKRLEKRSFKVDLAGRCIVTPGGDRLATVQSKKGSGSDSEVKVLELGALREGPSRAFTRNVWNDDANRKAPASRT